MVLGLFGKQKLLEEAEAQWLFDAYAWALRHFGAGVFYNETLLVVPSNEHFPGRENSVEDMARLIFGHVTRYAGMRHWPFMLTDGTTCAAPAPATVEIRGPLRGSVEIAQEHGNAPAGLPVAYDPALIGNPEALIASYAHTLAHHLGQTANEPPPGGAVSWPQATEVLAVFMGFGLMFANSAFDVPVRSCGGCGGPAAQRRSYLTQYESTYALAIFGVLKNIPNKAVVGHLKKPLRPFYKRCVAEVRGRTDDLDQLRVVSAQTRQLPVADPA